VNPIARRLAAIEAQLAEKTSDDVTPGQLKAMKEMADRAREAALDPHPGMKVVSRAYAATLLPMNGEQVPVYDDGWTPGERYWREVARIIGYTGLPNSAEVSAGINQCLDEDADATIRALNAIDERHRRGQR
jgi:hypothetical protein